MRKRKSIVKYLVDNGADLNNKYLLNKIPIFNACEKWKCKHSKIFQ